MTDKNLEIEMLQREIEQKRNNITNTVRELKNEVESEFEDRKIAIKQTFDWKHQAKEHPILACGLCLATGYMVGKKIGGSFSPRRRHGSESRVSNSSGPGMFGKAFSGMTEIIMKETIKTAQSLLVPMILGAVAGKVSMEKAKDDIKNDPEIPTPNDHSITKDIYGTDNL